jgi:hypothetical protein
MPTRSRILLDTSVLLLYAAGTFDPSLVGRSRLDEYSMDEFDIVRDRVSAYARRVTTPHLLAELSNLLDKVVPTRRHYEMRQFLRQFISQFDEVRSPANELSSTPVFLRLGLADAAVAAAALQDTEVLTADLNLHLMLLSLGIPSTNLNRLRP